MPRFKMNTVSVDVKPGQHGNYVLLDSHIINLKGKTFDEAGRLVGRVVAWDKSKRGYWVKFDETGFNYLFKKKDLHETHTLFPSDGASRPKNKIVHGMMKVRAWNQGKLETIYVEGKELHGGRAKIFYDSNNSDGLNVMKGRTYLDGQNILYFVAD